MALRRYTVETCHYCAKKSHKRRIFHRLAARCTPTQREKNEQRNSPAGIWKTKEISYQIKHNQWGFKIGIDNPMLTFNRQCVTLCTNFANQAKVSMCIVHLGTPSDRKMKFLAYITVCKVFRLYILLCKLFCTFLNRFKLSIKFCVLWYPVQIYIFFSLLPLLAFLLTLRPKPDKTAQKNKKPVFLNVL